MLKDLILVVAGYLLGRRSRLMDIRFQTLEKAVALHYRVTQAAVDYHRVVYGGMRPPMGDAREKEESKRVLYSFILEAAALTDILDLVFGEKAKAHWDKTFEHLKAAGGTEANLIDPLDAAELEYEKFLKLAAWDCGLWPWVRFRTKLREKLFEILRFGAGDLPGDGG